MGPRASPAGRLLDREAELAAAAGAIDLACSGSGSTLLVQGAAGIGKTSLLAHVCAHAAAAGMTVLTARAAEFEGGYAWGVVQQLFESETGSDGRQLLAGDAAALAAPALVHSTPPDEDDSFSVLHGLYWLTADIARRAPLLLAVDDLHWADQPSLRFVAYLARRMEGLPLLLVLAVREPRSGAAPEQALTADLAAEAGVTALRPAALSAAACAELVRGALRSDPSPAFQEACRETTRGNPLLLNGLLASLVAEGFQGTDADVPHLRRLTPDSVSRSVLLRLGRMPAAALAAARAVAVLGTAAFMAASLTIGRRIVFNLIRWTNDNFKSEFPVITIILVIMIAMALITQLIGVNTVLGAFVAGLLLAEDRPRHGDLPGDQRSADDIGVRRVLAADAERRIDARRGVIVDLHARRQRLERVRWSSARRRHDRADHDHA